jgi:hypothetical protein
MVERGISITSDELHNAFEYLDTELLPSSREQLSHFNNCFAIIPFVYYYFKDNTTGKMKLTAYAKWFAKNKRYLDKNFDAASSIDNFEHSPRTIFISMEFGNRTRDTFDAIEQARDTLKRDDGIELELIKVDDHKDGYSDEIYHRIKVGIEKAELVIADLTYGNHNVHHEIGYAQGLGKKVLLLWREHDNINADDEIGSNLKMHDQVRVSNISELRDKLIEKIRQCFSI